MFKQAQIKLTLFYSALFLILFWSFSFGLYYWMNNSFGEGFISQVKERQGQQDEVFNPNSNLVVTIAGDVALDQLLKVLLFLNGGLLVIIPIASWFLAKRTLSPIQKTHEQQKQFVSDASHEMRTPLSIINGEIEVALNKNRSSKDYKSVLNSTKEETSRLSKLVENLLFLASTDKNGKAISFESVDITDLISEIIRSLQPKAGEKKINILLKTDKVMTPIVSGQPDLLRQLFYNLLDNAIIYTPKKGRITITLSDVKGAISIAIKDNGIGIDEKDRGKIMERFYRVDSSRSQTKGFGLGLSIAKEIITKHKGQLLVSSELNKGSEFIVTLPK